MGVRGWAVRPVASVLAQRARSEGARWMRAKAATGRTALLVCVYRSERKQVESRPRAVLARRARSECARRTRAVPPNLGSTRASESL